MNIGRRRRVQRRLAAILSANVAGYSRLAHDNEEGALERLKAHLRELIQPKIREHFGHIVRTGSRDGMLAEFGSVIDALRCAAEIQRGMLDRDQDIAEAQRIRFQIGVDFGDVIAEGEDIGEGVDIASRLQTLAEPGGICISRNARDQVCDKLPYALVDLGEQSVCQIIRSAQGLALLTNPVGTRPMLTDLLPNGFSGPRSPGGPPRLSIVVLPFTDLSNDPEQEYFVDGITEDLMTDLSRLPDMVVISRNTAFTYQDKSADLEQIGRELNVRYVLEGSIRRAGNRVVADAQLMDAETGEGIWAERFEHETDDLFALQDEVTGRIAVALNLQIVSAEAARATRNPDTLDYILRGRAVLNRGATRQNFAEAMDLFASALAIDRGCDQAKALIAGALVGRVLNQLSDAAAADLEQAQALITEAQFSSASPSLVHFIKGQILRAQCRYQAAIPEYEATLALDRNAAPAFAALGQCKFFAGAIEESIPAQERALRLSPHDPNIASWYWRIGMVHLLQSRIDDAVLWTEKAHRANPQLAGPRAWLASACALRGETERAEVELARAIELSADRRYASIARFKNAQRLPAKLELMAESTFFAGLRKAGVPDE